MLVGIHQLHYLPWLRYFEKIAKSDVFVVLDNIQFNKNGWQNRNRIKTSNGATVLTVPVYAKLAQRLDEVVVNNQVAWQKKHWRTILQNYSKAPFFGEHSQFLEECYSREWSKLNDLNRDMLDYFIKALGIDTRVEYASDLDVPGQATERLVNLIKAVGGDAYYSGAYALEVYLDAELLSRGGIALELQQWEAPQYAQLHGHFEPDLAIIDLLLNCGPRSADILISGARRGCEESKID